MFRSSGTQDRNPHLADRTEDFRTAGNLEFLKSALSGLQNEGLAPDGRMAILLFGQRDIPGVTLRQAQSVLRWDLRPSLWSHVCILESTRPEAIGESLVREVPLYSRTGLFPEPARNAVSTAPLSLYGDRVRDANVAVLAVQMDESQVAEVEGRAIENPNLDRLRYNLWESLGIWQAYLWSASLQTNPLHQGFPVPASAFVEYCFEAVQVDLTPGGSERNSSPEHIWNGAVWWNEAFKEFGHAIHGEYVLRDKRCSLLSADEDESEAEEAVET